MNRYYGSERVGKKRAAALTAQELRAAANPIHGRSRAERLLDHSLDNLNKRQRLEASEGSSSGNPLRPDRFLQRQSDGSLKILLPEAERRPEAPPEGLGPKPRRAGAVTDTPAETLMQCLRRLDLKDKLFRTLKLIRRFFHMKDGKYMLELWQEAVRQGRRDFLAGTDSGMNMSEHIMAEAYLLFYVMWRIATSKFVNQSGDGRESFIILFEKIFRALDEETLARLADGSDQDPSVIKGNVYAAVEAHAPFLQLCSCVPSDPSLRSRIQMRPAAAPQLVTEISHVSNDSGEPAVGEDSEVNDSTLASARGETVSADGKEVEVKRTPFFTRPIEWYLLYQQLVPILRLAVLAHNNLYTDDSVIFQRAVNAIKRCYDSLPENPPPESPSEEPPHDPSVSFTEWEWFVPNGSDLMRLKRKVFMDTLPTLFVLRSVVWARLPVEMFFNELYMNRKRKFTVVEQDEVERWQAQIKALGRTAISSPMPLEPAVPGAAHVPITDTRVEVINTTSGSQAWARRQMPS